MRMFEEKRNQDLMEFLKSMQAMVGQNQNNGTHSKLSDFQRTKPPSFGQAVDPIKADDWLRTMEKKLEIAHCDESYKVPFVTRYLEGPAAIWWDNAKNGVASWGRHFLGEIQGVVQQVPHSHWHNEGEAKGISCSYSRKHDSW